MKKIYIVYKFINTITGDFYIGHRNKKKKSLSKHKYQSVCIAIPNDQLYQDIQKYGVEKFEFQVLAEVEPEQLKEVEQQFIQTLKPAYNNYNENDWDIETYKNNKKESETPIEFYDVYP